MENVVEKEREKEMKGGYFRKRWKKERKKENEGRK